MRLDQLQALVHHGGRIDRNLGAHVPVGMGHRLLGRRLGHVGQRPVAERPARRGQDQPLDGGALAGVEHLEDRVVLGIDRQQHAARLAAPRRSAARPAQTSASLLASATMRAAPRRRQGRRQPGGADDRRHHPFGRPRRRLDHRLAARPRPRSTCRPARPSARDSAADWRPRPACALQPPRLLGQRLDGLPATSASTR